MYTFKGLQPSVSKQKKIISSMLHRRMEKELESFNSMFPQISVSLCCAAKLTQGRLCGRPCAAHWLYGDGSDTVSTLAGAGCLGPKGAHLAED